MLIWWEIEELAKLMYILGNNFSTFSFTFTRKTTTRRTERKAIIHFPWTYFQGLISDLSHTYVFPRTYFQGLISNLSHTYVFPRTYFQGLISNSMPF
ncbi:unnamed protein product [Coffea canephora]|uniref:DH200=94 genomic scaffold, scaffold_2596 n=1 Tax=Coffea canephora TaxID=49390 RepID=A0A068VK17_COFCA|nr:unnamed protein product [Coffea canephora]